MGKKGQRIKAKRRRQRAAREASLAKLGQTQSEPKWYFDSAMPIDERVAKVLHPDE